MKPHLTLILALAITAASCVNQESIPVDEDRPMILAPASEELTKSATVPGALPAAYGLNVSASWNTGSGHNNYFTGIPFTYYGGAWAGGTEAAPNRKYMPHSGSLDLLAFGSVGLKTPASGVAPTATWNVSNVASATSLSVPAMDATFDDVLYGAANSIAYTATSVPLSMNHACCAVVFVFKSADMPYTGANVSANRGFTVTGVSVDNVKTAGTLSVSNGGAAGGASPLTATWTTLTGSSHSVPARVFAGTAGNASEAALSGLNVTRIADANLATDPFGDAYVIIPVQGTYSQATYGKGTQITVTYTMHNGTAGNIVGVVQAIDCSAHSWGMAQKVVYTFDFAADEVSVTCSSQAWEGIDISWTYANATFAPWGTTTINKDLAEYHGAVDQGLRRDGKKILFATCNVRAGSPEQYGDYYAWGETAVRYVSISGTTFRNAPFWDDSAYTRYNDTDNKLTLDPEDDVAHVKWGDGVYLTRRI